MLILPLVAVDLWYHVGAANEVKGKSGFAHLFEHLMFQGSKHVVGDEHVFFGILESIGATNLNGTISMDQIPLYSQPTLVSGVGITYARDRRDNPADPRSGSFNTADASFVERAKD